MHTYIKHPDAFSIVVLERQLISDSIKLHKPNNHLYSKRNLLWVGICYTVVLYIITFFI